MGVAGNAVLLAGIDLHIEINSCVNQGLDVRGGVAKEHVVIIQAVNNEQAAMKLVYAVNGRCIMIAVGILLGLLHETLGVGSIIVTPVCYRSNRYATFEYRRALAHRHKCIVTTVAPAPDCNALSINIGQGTQIFGSSHLVLAFHYAQMLVGLLFEIGPATTGASTVNNCNSVSFSS